MSRKESEMNALIQNDGNSTEVKMVLQREIDALTSENRMLKDKMNAMSDELYSKKRNQSNRDQQQDGEVQSLR